MAVNFEAASVHYLVVANSQALAVVDRWGMARHRWEATNLKNDPNITMRDVPTKFGDDCMDGVKHYLQTFAVEAAPLTRQQQIEEAIPERLRLSALESGQVTGSEGWWMAKARKTQLVEAAMKQQEDSKWEKMWRDTV